MMRHLIDVGMYEPVKLRIGDRLLVVRPIRVIEEKGKPGTEARITVRLGFESRPDFLDELFGKTREKLDFECIRVDLT